MNKQEYAKKLEILSRRKKHPLSMQLELTPLCTLNCKMCYVLLRHHEVEALGGITSTEQWLKIIDEALDAGVLNITLTGGEAMLHPGFKEIYKRAYDKGALVSVITNATLISDEIIALFANRPPESISVTLYGMSYQTYSALCGNGDAYYKVIDSVRTLVQKGFKVALQTTLTKDNLADIPLIRKFANELQIPYSFNNYLVPFGQCSADCVRANEVSPEDRERLLTELNPTYCETQRELLDSAMKALDTSEMKSPKELIGMRCGAGNNSFQVNWKGEMGLCTMMDVIRYDVRHNSLIKGWNLLVQYAKTIPQIPECMKCTHLNCVRCVAMHYADKQQYGVRSERLCPILRSKNTKHED